MELAGRFSPRGPIGIVYLLVDSIHTVILCQIGRARQRRAATLPTLVKSSERTTLFFHLDHRGRFHKKAPPLDESKAKIHGSIRKRHADRHK